MTEFLSFFVILFAAVFFSAVFNRLHLPWVVALIVGGVVIGPFGLDIFEPNGTLELLGQIGLMFLMFMAGLETRVARLREHWREVATLGVANSLIPFCVGSAIALLLGYELIPALLLGIIFISTSIAIVVPSLEANGIFHTRVGSVTVAATIFEDILSLLALSLLLQAVAPVTQLPLWIFYPLLLIVLIALRWAIPRLRTLFSFGRSGKDLFQQELRLLFTILLGVVILFEVMGLHTIVAGFFTGLVLSDSVTSHVLKEKLRAISYGIFIPIFFVLIGTKTNLGAFRDGQALLWQAAVIILGSVGSKFVSGWLGARASGLSTLQSTLVGAATTPSLTTTLAVAFTALSEGLLDQAVVTILVMLSVITTLMGPLAINLMARRAAKVTIIPKPVTPAPLEETH